MKQTISNIAEELIKMNAPIINSYHLGLRNGLTGISLFFYYYARLTEDERYEKIAEYNFEKVITGARYYMNYFFASEFADIGRTTRLLNKEKFIKTNPDELTKYFDEPLIKRIRKDLGLDFGFCTGITGICDYFQNKGNNEEVSEITFKQIYGALRVKGYPMNPVNPLTLFPPEVLRDVKLFFLKSEKGGVCIPDKKRLYKAIQKIESKNVTQNNSSEYTVLQDLREAVILEDNQKIQSLTEILAKNSSDLIFKGLSMLSLEDDSISAWRSLV
ncbi:MAG: hypothetical protein FWF53_04850 [Candidatus Azobacteroides sp.]|nr:hypothetical protein [Candidatus Azobacteroides sp.]